MKRAPLPPRPWLLLPLAGALLHACAAGDTSTTGDDAQVDVAPADAPADVAAEQPAPDAATEAGIDATADATDAGIDAQPDAMPDAMPDAAPDATPDAAPDATPDAAPDATLDAAPDATPDAAPDATPDAAPDATPEASVDAGGPLEVPLPSSTVMTSVTRLGQRAFVLASVENVDATPEGDRLSLRYVERVGHRLAAGATFTLPIATIASGSDNPIMLMGALGPAHFFVVLNLPGYRAVLRLFAWRGGAFVDLGETPLVAGATFTQTPAFFGGHPVDDTRHLLGYRERDSGQPFRYRLIVRSGDAVSFGPAVTRPSAFTGLATGESQADPALVRVGPTTFVEARPGYVYAPGDLATWVLDVRADNTLTATGGVTHATTNLTMTPEVAADGRGNALFAYYGYPAMPWQLATYAHAGRALTERGMLAPGGAVSIRAHQGESTDRSFGGAWYLRLPGTSRAPVPLYRIDAASLGVTTVAMVPSMWACYRVPQVVRLGTIAAYTGCDGVTFVDLLPTCGNGTADPGELCDDGDNLDGDGCSAACRPE